MGYRRKYAKKRAYRRKKTYKKKAYKRKSRSVSYKVKGRGVVKFRRFSRLRK